MRGAFNPRCTEKRRMHDAQTWKKPKIIAITNESPDWSDLDKQYGHEMWTMLLHGLEQEGYDYRAFKYYDHLNFLDAFDPREWLVWNWGEELAGVPWSEAAVAAELERRGFAHTGSPSDVIAFAQNRQRVKQRLQAAGLPTLPWCVFTDPAQATEWTAYPAIVKGANQHASFGITRDSVVHDAPALASRIAALRREYQDDALVEPFLDTREFQVAVWGNDPPEALPPTEFVYTMFDDVRDRLYTLDWKFDRDSRGYKEIQMPCPAPLDRPDWRARLEEIALQAYRVMGLRDYGRFDLRMRGDEPQILDVNPNPDLDHISVVLAGAKTKGMDYGQMVSQIIRFASARLPR
jgi:D-alanine-D-alanine ligase